MVNHFVCSVLKDDSLIDKFWEVQVIKLFVSFSQTNNSLIYVVQGRSIPFTESICFVLKNGSVLGSLIHLNKSICLFSSSKGFTDRCYAVVD